MSDVPPEGPTAPVAGETANSQITTAQYQGGFHDALRDELLADLLAAGNNCEKEVDLTFGSVTARIDILCNNVNGILIGTEIKTLDNPDYTDQQKIVYPHAILGYGVFSPAEKIGNLGYVPFAPLPPFDIELVYAPGPGLPYRVISLRALLLGGL